MLARRVLLVDDHPVFRTGLRRVLEATGRYEIVGEAGNAHEAIRAAEETRPGLILLDVQLPGITGLRITRILRRKQTRARIVVLSVHMDDDRIIEAVRAVHMHSAYMDICWVGFEELRPGMVLDEDIIADNGETLMFRGEEITSPLLTQLREATAVPSAGEAVSVSQKLRILMPA